MKHKELTAQLRRMSVETGSLMCLGCGYEHNCGIHGCALLRQAVETIERQDAAIEDLRDHECSGLLEEYHEHPEKDDPPAGKRAGRS